MQQDVCPCCSNHCAKDNLSCGRGLEYFNSSTSEKDATLEEKIVGNLRKCGHILHHNPEMKSNLLLGCTKEELEQLHQLLSKITNTL